MADGDRTVDNGVNVAALLEAREALTNAPEAAQFKWRAACEWKDGLVEGSVYDFVSWHADGKCGAKCPASANYKRLTVIVTTKAPAGNHEPAALRVSTLIV